MDPEVATRRDIAGVSGRVGLMARQATRRSRTDQDRDLGVRTPVQRDAGFADSEDDRTLPTSLQEALDGAFAPARS